MLDSTLVVLELWHLRLPACAMHGVAQGIMCMRSPSKYISHTFLVEVYPSAQPHWARSHSDTSVKCTSSYWLAAQQHILSPHTPTHFTAFPLTGFPITVTCCHERWTKTFSTCCVWGTFCAHKTMSSYNYQGCIVLVYCWKELYQLLFISSRHQQYHWPPDANAGCWEILFSSRNNTEAEDSMHVDLCLTINVQNMAEADRKCQTSWLS